MNLNRSKIDWRELEFQEIGIWPFGLQILVILVCCLISIGVCYQFSMCDYLARLDALTGESASVRDNFKMKHNKAVNLPAYQKQMLDINQQLDALLRKLPSERQVSFLIDDIYKQASVSNVQYELIRPDDEKDFGFYVELPLSLTVLGDYHEIGDFVSGLANLPRIVTLHDFTLKSKLSEKGDMPLKVEPGLEMEILVKTYWLSGGQEKTVDVGARGKVS